MYIVLVNQYKSKKYTEEKMLLQLARVVQNYKVPNSWKHGQSKEG